MNTDNFQDCMDQINDAYEWGQAGQPKAEWLMSATIAMLPISFLVAIQYIIGG